MLTPNRIRLLLGILVAGSSFGLLLPGGCASDPPPPPAAPAPATAVEATPPAPPAVETAAAPVAEPTPVAAEPECQTADDCKKLHEPASGLQWTCENAHCLEQAIPDAPKPEAAAEPANAEKTSKKGKGKGGKKK